MEQDHEDLEVEEWIREGEALATALRSQAEGIDQVVTALRISLSKSSPGQTARAAIHEERGVPS